MKKDIEWLKESVFSRKKSSELNVRTHEGVLADDFESRAIAYEKVLKLIDQLDVAEILSDEWIDEHAVRKIDGKENPLIVYVDDLQNLLVPKQEEPTQEQVQKYLSEHGIEVVENEPETVADVISDFWKSFERLKEVLGTEVEELEE